MQRPAARDARPRKGKRLSFANVRALVAAARNESAALRECADALHASAYEEVGPGRTTVREALATFQIRRHTAREAGIAVEGIDELLATLCGMSPESELGLFSFSGTDRVFTVFIADDRLAGCIRVTRGPRENI